ncbi:NAD(P) transhydrogenase subunit alpha [Sphingomonas crusticola]|uniref:NAD(P) transhydrogenase subunit alpha n=1 Tax=Sphingomonas crusticola TaxID=1697973 RepID=UPI000E2720B1|nr:NAD(P) transhydrogenase subunit alpha [Sphingomonas crusticola]
MDFISILSIFVLACFVGYYVVWSVTPALHTPLMAVTNAISSVIIVGALIASAAGVLPVLPAKIVATSPAQPVAVDKDIAPTGVALAEKVVVAPPVQAASGTGHALSKWLGLIAVALASVNIFGGFAVTARMLAMYKKKDRPAVAK